MAPAAHRGSPARRVEHVIAMHIVNLVIGPVNLEEKHSGRWRNGAG